MVKIIEWAEGTRFSKMSIEDKRNYVGAVKRVASHDAILKQIEKFRRSG
jgi:hypothetical protein